MNSQDYQQFTEQLKQNLDNNPHVVGLVALGSMAQTDHQPDAWSDHDFFVVVESGRQEDFRQDLHWLPYPENILLSYRETAHGLKVFYRHGHLIEFAVFDTVELHLAKVNAYRVLLDKADLENALHQIQAASASQPPTDEFLVGQLLAHLFVGAGRYARGEQMSGHIFIKTYALYDLLTLIAKYHTDTSHLDNLDSYRRFEFVFPEMGADLNKILLLPPIQTALAFLDMLESQFAHRLPNYPVEAVEMVRGYLQKI